MTKGYYTRLPARAAVAVSGADSRAFLQGLITQDIERLAPGTVLYSALLTPQGKYDFDFFLALDGDAIRLDCEAARANDLAKKLSMYKLRKALTITTEPLDAFAVWVDDSGPITRAYAPPEGTEVDFDTYDRLRLSLGLPDGSRDFARGEDTVADMGLEKLGGVSFTKGCYMGQELTSRMHHRGLGKKGLYAVKITSAARPPFTDITADGQLIGQMRSSNGDRGLAMLRHDGVSLAPRAGLTVQTVP